jgi:hypothetical protein
MQTTLGDWAKALGANIIVFYACLYAASGNLLPTGGLESVWFLSGLALWFLALLSAPWFVPPKDALASIRRLSTPPYSMPSPPSQLPLFSRQPIQRRVEGRRGGGEFSCAFCTVNPTWEDSNLHIPDREMPFEISGEFRLFSTKSGVGDFCSWKLIIPDTHPSRLS